MPVPKVVKCPMCGNIMNEMGRKNTSDLTMSTMNYSETDQNLGGRKKHFVRTKVFVCKKCRNIQSFLLTNPEGLQVNNR